MKEWEGWGGGAPRGRAGHSTEGGGQRDGGLTAPEPPLVAYARGRHGIAAWQSRPRQMSGTKKKCRGFGLVKHSLTISAKRVDLRAEIF